MLNLLLTYKRTHREIEGGQELPPGQKIQNHNHLLRCCQSAFAKKRTLCLKSFFFKFIFHFLFFAMIFPHCYFAFEDNKLPKIVPGKCNLEQGSCRVNVHFGLVMNCLFGAWRINWEGEVLAGLRKDGGGRLMALI